MGSFIAPFQLSAITATAQLHLSSTTEPFKEAKVHFEEANGPFSLVYNFIETSVSETRFTQDFTYLRPSPEL